MRELYNSLQNRAHFINGGIILLTSEYLFKLYFIHINIILCGIIYGDMTLFYPSTADNMTFILSIINFFVAQIFMWLVESLAYLSPMHSKYYFFYI